MTRHPIPTPKQQRRAECAIIVELAASYNVGLATILRTVKGAVAA
jgi:hypothetical protein